MDEKQREKERENDRNIKLNQMRVNLILQFNKNKAEKFFNQNMYSNVDIDTLFIFCLPSFMKNVEERDKNDQILISIFLYQQKRFINLFKHNMMNLNEKLDSKFYDSLRFISSNIMYSKFNNNRLLMRYGEEGKKFYLLLQGEVAILIPIKKLMNITINEYKRYIALLIIYKEYKLLIEVLKENNVVFDMELDFFNDVQNYDKHIGLLQSINVLNKEEKQDEIDKDKYRKDLTQLLDLYLTPEEKKFYNKYVYTKKNKQYEEKDDGIFLSPREYMNRINQYYNFDFDKVTKELEKIERESRLKKAKVEDNKLNTSTESINYNEAKMFLIYDYHRVTELTSGEMFGDQALSSSTSQRTATIITIAECHFGFLTEGIYTQSIKEYNEKNRRNRICYLCNVPIMNSFSYKMIEKRYYNSFVFKGAKRNEIILNQNDINKNIILFKEGVFEISFKGSINDICDIVNYYMRQYHLISRKKNDINDEVFKSVLTMNRQKKKINRLFFNEINNEFDNKILLINSPNIFGMAQTEREENFFETEKERKIEKKNYFSFYEIKCYSMFAEYVLLDKKLFEEEIMKDDKVIIAKRNIFLREFFEKIIKRLLVIRYGKIWNLFLEKGIFNQNNGVNIDWNKFELDQDFVRGINKLIDAINEYKFLSNDIDKNINKYFKDKKSENIKERQKLKNIYNNQYLSDKFQEALNLRNINDYNFQNKGNMINYIKHFKQGTLRAKIKKITFRTNRNNSIISKRNNPERFNNFFSNKNNDETNKDNKDIKKIKHYSFFPENDKKMNKTFKNIFPKIQESMIKSGRRRFNSIDKTDNIKLPSEDKIIKKVYKKRVSFYSPKLNSFHSGNNLRLHLCLYDTFKKFGESHSQSVIKKTKVVKFMEYVKKVDQDDE